MLVVTANWNVSDGSLAPTAATARAARAWLRGVRLATVRSGVGRDGRYRPVAGLDVVLAGDTFDTLVSAEWTGRTRPWRAGARATETRERVLLGCARRAAPLLAGLARLVRAGLPIPAGDRRGRPTVERMVRVPVRAVLLPGDRDRHVVDVAPAIAARGGVVAPAWSDETALVAHGHEFDPFCHVAPDALDERAPSLAESVAVDLVVPFAVMIERLEVPRHLRTPLVAALAAAEPADLPAVLASWCGAGDGADATAWHRAVREAWRRAVDSWLRTARREPPECGLPASPVEALAGWFAAAAGGRPPRSLEGLFATGQPPRRGRSAAGRVLVLGHPPTAADAAICLGRPPVRRCGPVTVTRGSTATDVACVAARPPVAPATVVCRRDGGPPAWLWGGVAGADALGARPGPVVDAA